MIRRLALIVPLAVLAIVVATIVVFACQPDPRIPTPRVVIVPCAVPKSLATWWEMEQTTADNAPFDFAYPYKEPPFFPLAYYVGSVAPENLVAERTEGVRLRWGPMAIETPYTVAWRGMDWIVLEVPAEATDEQIAAWQAETQRCEKSPITFEVRRGPASREN